MIISFFSNLLNLILFLMFNGFSINLIYFSKSRAHETISQLNHQLSQNSTLFKCPEINVKSLFKLESESDLGTLKKMDYFLDINELSPFVGSSQPLHKNYLIYLEPFLKEYFPHAYLPKKINIIQTSSIKPLSALYCPKLKNSMEEFTLLITHETTLSFEFLLKTIVHEYVHHFFNTKKISLSIWIEEGVALYSSFMFSQKPNGGSIVEHFNKPHSSFMKDINNPLLSQSAYGELELFFIYLHNFFMESLFKQIIADDGNFHLAMDKILKNNSELPWKNFFEIYRDFQIAKYINRIDYFAIDKINKIRYYIFQSTLHASYERTNKTGGNCYIVNNSEFKSISIKEVIQKSEMEFKQSPFQFVICVDTLFE